MKVNEIITAKIIAALDAGGIAPWRKPWSINGLRNAITKRLYRGVNVFILSFFGNDDFFLTYNQAKSLGGNVKKGAKGLPVVFWSRIESKTEVDAKGRPKMVGFHKYYTVFSVNDCENLKWERPTVAGIVFEPIACAEQLVAKLTNGCTIGHGGERAFYRPSSHTITMPRKETFISVPHYYATLFHEIGHSLHAVTEKEGLGANFGSEPYSKEELVAEIFSSYCLNHCGILATDLFDNSAAYLASWKRKLTDDASLIMSAASKAQRRFDNLLGTKYESESVPTS